MNLKRHSSKESQQQITEQKTNQNESGFDLGFRLETFGQDHDSPTFKNT